METVSQINTDKSYNKTFVYLVLHVVPGILIFLFYILFAPHFVNLGFQSSFALHLGFLLIGIPLEICILLYTAKKYINSFDIRRIIKYTNKMPIKDYIIYIGLLYIYYYIVIMLLIEPLSKTICSRFFYWAPQWYLERGTFIKGNPSTLIVMLSFSVRITADGLINPFVEELYFRGYLLPKLEKYGAGAPIINALLFSVAHLWQPFNFLMLFMTVLPVYFIVWKRKNILLSIIFHCSANFISSIIMLVQYLR